MFFKHFSRTTTSTCKHSKFHHRENSSFNECLIWIKFQEHQSKQKLASTIRENILSEYVDRDLKIKSMQTRKNTSQISHESRGQTYRRRVKRERVVTTSVCAPSETLRACRNRGSASWAFTVNKMNSISIRQVNEISQPYKWHEILYCKLYKQALRGRSSHFVQVCAEIRRQIEDR